MTLFVHIGRRVPRSWYRRTAQKVQGLLTFQEHIWQMVSQGMQLAKKKANADGRMSFKMERETEIENMNYEIKWIKMIIQGTPDMEEEELQDTLKMYDKLKNSFKQDFTVDENLSKCFKTKLLPQEKVNEAYKKGFGSTSENNIANKLLEMGILTHVEKIDDYETRTEQFF